MTVAQCAKKKPRFDLRKFRYKRYYKTNPSILDLYMSKPPIKSIATSLISAVPGTQSGSNAPREPSVLSMPSMPRKSAKPGKSVHRGKPRSHTFYKHPRPTYRRFGRLRKVALSYTVKRVPRITLASLILLSGALGWQHVRKEHRSPERLVNQEALAENRHVSIPKAICLFAGAAFVCYLAQSPQLP